MHYRHRAARDDQAGKQLRFEALVVLHLGALVNALHALAAETLHQIVLQGEEEHRSAHVHDVIERATSFAEVDEETQKVRERYQKLYASYKEKTEEEKPPKRYPRERAAPFRGARRFRGR